MIEKLTPMMQQYWKVKDEHKDCILFYRLGDFYEMFFDDAILASKELEITLTGRSCGLPERAPMCGVPFHSADSYISRLVAKGYKVAICEQVEDPKEATGIVDRGVVRIITPGTTLDDSILDSRKMNYIACVFKNGNDVGLSFCDLSTGEVMVSHIEDDENLGLLISELQRFMPVEIILNFESFHHKKLKNFIDEKLDCISFTCEEDWFSYEASSQTLVNHFKENADEAIKDGFITASLGCLLRYLVATQKDELRHINEINFYTVNQYMELDLAAQRNLELVETMRDKHKRGSLLWVIDNASTSMGHRTIKKWLLRPLLSAEHIEKRLDSVEELVKCMQQRNDLTEIFGKVLDIERLMSKVSLGIANPRDLVALKQSFSVFPEIYSILNKFRSPLLCEATAGFDTLTDLTDLIERGIKDEPPISVRDGGIIKEFFNEEIDRLNYMLKNGKNLIADVEAREKEATGIKNLKVGFNKVFGYYIEISNSNLDKVPENYTRKQTLTNGERFITPELKQIEVEVLGAEERLVTLEYNTFCEIRQRINDEMMRVKMTAHAIGMTDALCSLATLAEKSKYTRPTIKLDGKIRINEGRHPVVEKILKNTLFVPNDTYLDNQNFRTTILTGPNMAGKSTYMRQVALIVILAQIGSFVPAKEAEIGIVDKIFTRVGASDDLSAGQSTFMVEMSEMADIIKNATENSLLIVDEIGRGTSTYDGLSIAWAVVEYCAEKIKAKTLFATHYHELTELEGRLEGVKNFCVAVKKRGDDITFLHKIVAGGADQSYGVLVAKISGMPSEIIERAKTILKELEETDINRAKHVQLNFQDVEVEEETPVHQVVVEKLKKLDVTTLSPIEAMNILYNLQKEVNEA